MTLPMMISRVPILGFLVLLVFIPGALVSAEPGTMRKQYAADVAFINVSGQPFKIFWQEWKDAGSLRFVAEIPPYDWIHLNSEIGHKFSYQAVTENDDGEFLEVQVLEKESTFALGPEHFEVLCSTTEGDIHAHVIPKWSPRGAARFIHMVDIGFYDGTALYRVIPKFLTQFGISANRALNNQWKRRQIPDDPPQEDLAFETGFLSYAGSGPNSRTTQVFVVMPETRQSQLNYFGKNPWETPFGYVDAEDVENVVTKWYSYGDMPSQGNKGGPDQQRIYQDDGYEYLKNEFPKMSYIQKCRVVSTEPLPDEEAEEL